MKKLLTGFIALIMALGFVAVSQPRALAADAPESLTAYLTIALQNKEGAYDFAKAKDGTEMAAKAVQVSDVDGDGKLTAYDMLYCAHKLYAPGGLKDFETSSAAKGMATAKKIWNVESSFLLLDRYKQAPTSFSTNIKVGSGNAVIASNSHLYVVQNYESKADFFSNSTQKTMLFANDARITAYKGQEFTLCANTFNNSKPNLAPVKKVSAAKSRDVYYKKARAETGTKIATTPATGKITAKFDETGDYLIYTVPKDGAAPAACMVHVEENRPVPESIQLGLSEASTDLLHYTSGTKEYSITVPDSATTLYGRMAYASASGNLQWYSEVSTDGTTYKSVNVKGLLDGKTTGTINIRGAQKLKLYINDTSLQLAKDKPLSDDYIINIKRQIQLTGLTTSGSLLSDADYTTGHLDVYVSHDAQTATLAPTVKSGDTITVNGETAVSGEAATINLTDAKTTATIIVHRDGDSYVDGTYTVTFHKATDQAAPVFIEQPTQEVQEYIVGDGKADVKPLHVFANANGAVTYQWYFNTTKSTEGGTKVEGATSTAYSPATDTAGERYYYCIASNGDSKTSSAFAHVIVYEYPIKSISWSMEIPDLPQDKADLFGENKKGFYYEKGDTDVTPLTVAVTYEPHFAKLIEDGTIRVRYNWGPLNDSVPTSLPSYKPSTDYEIGGREWYCRVSFNYLGEFRNFNKTTSDPVYVYIGKDSSSRPDTIKFTGAGTQTSPWELSSQADLETLRAYVEGGYDFADTYLIFTTDIALDENWKSIGTGDAGAKGKGWNVFSGTLDGGNHTLTYAENTDQPLFKFVREATVQNLSIQAPHLKNFALVSDYVVDYGDDGNYNVGTGGSYAPGCPDTIDIINVTIKSGSVIEKGGFLGGFASGGNVVNIRSCVVEKGVTIGTEAAGNIGSFGGLFNGTITDCVSYADVVGSNFVGGLVGQKGQSMGPYTITNSAFLGTVTSTGKYVGGIAGGGYAADSAPNTPGATIQNCYVSGTITGADCVGGILGGEPSQIQAWDTSYIQDNCFYGTVTATDENASCGGIVGRFKSLNINNTISNNYFLEGCGADNGIGAILYLDTSADVTAENCEVFDTSKELPKIRGVSLSNLNRTDDPLGTDADKLAAKKTADEFKDGTVVSLLNASDSSWKNWTQGTNGPVHSREPIFYRLEVSGSYKATYKQGEELDLTGIEFTAYRSDNTSVKLSLQDVKQLNTFDPQFIGAQTITFRYGVGEATITLAVHKDYTDADRENFKSVEVLFSLSEDDAFKTGTSNTVLANVPLKVTYFDLSQYGLEAYNYHENGKLVEEPTVLHLFITALERYGLGLSEDACGKGRLTVGTNWLTVTGGAGHLYMTSFWKHGANLIYDVNGKYPMKPDGSMGATADEIVLKDGDFVDVAMFSDASFYTHETSGFHFFAETQNTPQKLFRVPHGEELTLSYMLSHSDMGSGSDVASTLTTVSGESVYSGKSLDANSTATATTGEDGKVTLTFAAEGTYYAWTKGGKVAIDNNPNLKPVVVSAPGCATIVVTKTAAEVDAMIDAIDENTVTAASGEAIGNARAAYDALSEKTKSEVIQLSKLERLEAKYGPYREVDIVREMIGKLPETAALKLTHREAVDAAKAAYDKLTAEQKKYLTSAEVTKLNDAVSRIAYLTRYPVTAVTVTPDTITASVKGTTIVLTGYCDKLSDIRLYDQDGKALDVQDGRFTAYGVSYSVDYSGVAERPVEVTIVETKPTAEVSDTASDPVKAKAAAKQISNSDETKSTGLSTAASTELVSTAKDIANAVPAESIPEGGKVEVKAEPSLRIEVKDYVETDEKKELTLDITPVVTYTTTVKNADDAQVGKETVTEAKIENKDIKAPVTISIPLPAGIVPNDNLYVKHELEGGVEYIKPTFKKAADGEYYIATWQQSSFSIVTFLFDARSATVSIGGRDISLLPSDVGGDLPTASKDGMIFTGWSFEIDGKKYDGPYTKLTDDLLTAMDDARKAGKTITATPNFKERPASIKIDSPNKPKKDTVTVDASKFNDVSRSDWYYNAVQYALENGLMNGTSDWAFSPNADTTRGMIVTILARLDGVNTSGNPWYAAGRTWAMNAGVSDGTNIEGKITREQLAAMLYRYAKAKGYDVAASADISGYTDASNVSSWAVDAMRWAVGAGLINGRTATTLAPQGNATRAEVAAILMRFAQNVEK